MRSFNLNDPQDILRSPNRCFQRVPNTCWFVRPHGIGVHIFKAPESGGVDFDFDKPHPDEWRLARFIEAQVNDGQLPFELYRALTEDEEVMKSAVQEALRGI